MTSEKSEVQIDLSSDTINSPERSTDFEIIESDSGTKSTKLIVISDTELEEGEINDEEEEEVAIKEHYDDERLVVDHKRKCGELGTEINKRRRYEKSYIEELPIPECDVGIHTEEFAWSELRILMVGDERVVALNWEEWSDFPEQDLYYLPNCNLNSLCTLAEKHLYKEYDVVFLIGFHYDFISHEDSDSELNDSNKSSVIDLKSNININEIIKTVQKFHYKWVRQYPNTNIIWTIPSPPDFLKYNSVVLKEKGLDPEKKLNKKIQYTLSKDYFELSRKLAKEWREKSKYVPVFPLNKVLFMKKQCYKKSFLGGTPPKFPRGFLRDGLYPTKMMAIHCAYLLVEYLIDEGFYPENKVGLNLAEAEAKLIRLEPDTKSFLYSIERYGRKHPKHSRHHSYKYRKNDDNSVSPQSSSDGSRSRSRSRRSRYHGRSRSRKRYRTRSRERYKTRSNSRERYKTRSKSKERYRTRSMSRDRQRTQSRSRSRSVSRERHRGKDYVKAKTRSRSKGYSQRHPRSSTSSSSSSTSRSTPELKKADGVESSQTRTEKNSSDEVRRTNIKDEVSFWKTLRDLREVHDIQCMMYRRKPHTHPQFKAEKEKFFKDFQQKPARGLDLSNWDDYWRQRMEEIFEESWASKKKQLTIDLNQKGAFTSLNAFPDSNVKTKGRSKEGNDNPNDQISSTLDILDERSKFKQENADTINSYLNEFETTLESTESHGTEKASSESKPTIDSSDFTLADIFKDSPLEETHPCDNKEDIYSKSKLVVKGALFGFPEPINSGKPVSPPAHDMPPSFYPKSEEEEESESSQCSESDLDVDDLMENPDFLQGLEEIDKELQNAVPSDDRLNNSGAQTLLPSSMRDLNSIKSKEDKTKEKVYNEENLQLEFVNVLRMLFRVSKRLGPLGLSVSALYHRASEDLRNKRDKFPSLNSDSKSLLALVDKKLNLFLKENLPQVQKAIYGEISERLQVLLDKINVEHDRFQKVNVHSIAVATLGQEVSQVVSFIKNTLLYHGYTQYTSDDVMNIYMSVKASQLDMEKS